MAPIGIATVSGPLPPPSQETAMAIAPALPTRDRGRNGPAAWSDRQKRQEKARREGLGAHVDLQV
jgi:hypothetical protein